MSKRKNNYYVVWKGHQVGVFDSWQACEKEINGFPGALYKGFPELSSAQKAFSEGVKAYYKTQNSGLNKSQTKIACTEKPILESISVDAACNMKTGVMEYQGVYTHNKKLIFIQGPFKDATNNIGEFLALVHALAYCKKHHIGVPIYSDSVTAMKWVERKKTATKQELTTLNDNVFDLIYRAEQWLQTNDWSNKVLKWHTEEWGEIPADFGRK